MDRKEFIIRMKELGWNDEEIDKSLKFHDEQEKEFGVKFPYDDDLFEAPINY